MNKKFVYQVGNNKKNRNVFVIYVINCILYMCICWFNCHKSKY